jgi:hypothetical protein
MVTDGIERVWREKLRFVVPTVMEGMKEEQIYLSRIHVKWHAGVSL